MCGTVVVVTDLEDANAKIAKLVAEQDLQGAIDVAQVLCVLCETEEEFCRCIGSILSNMSSEVDILSRRGSIGIKEALDLQIRLGELPSSRESLLAAV